MTNNVSLKLFRLFRIDNTIDMSDYCGQPLANKSIESFTITNRIIIAESIFAALTPE